MRTHNSDLGRRSPEGGRVLCREYVLQDTLGQVVAHCHHDKLIQHRLGVT